MEPQPKPERLTREKAHAIIERLLADSLETRRSMEESFHKNPGIQQVLKELRQLREQKQAAPSDEPV